MLEGVLQSGARRANCLLGLLGLSAPEFDNFAEKILLTAYIPSETEQSKA